MLDSGHDSAFQNIEQIIKLFYERFKVERATVQQQFVCETPGITVAEQEQLTSLLLNRLMFIYFLQKQGFLNRDHQYLSHQLQLTQQRCGRDHFYRSFLLALFHDILGKPERSTEMLVQFGQIPYLGGSLFAVRPIERQYPEVSLPDHTFERLFAFFDLYRWYVDEPAGQEKSLLTPDILGYIFEQYVNQQQMGAYYTREDVTTYIANNTIIPAFFDALARRHPCVFAADGTLWRLVQQQPERYIHEILAETDYLPDETPREHLQRLQVYQHLYARLAAGHIRGIDDFITYNLRIHQFARDALRSLEDTTLLQDCYLQLQQMTILDPTCGSGAFLLAGLRTLLPLYETCLDQMQRVNGPSICDEQKSVRRASILKTIITRNLYGIDIMEGAVEICKLHLFLKLMAQVAHAEDIEPLPDIDGNICVGNTLAELHIPCRSISLRQITDEHAGTALTPGWQLAFRHILEDGGFTVIIGNPPYVEYNEQRFPYSLDHFITHGCANLYTCIVERSKQLLSPQGRHGMILPLAAFATKNMQPFLSAFRSWFPVSWLSFYHFRPSMLFSGGKVASIPTTIYLAKPDGPVQRYSTHLMKWTHEQRPFLFTRFRYHAISAPIDPLNRHYYPKFSHACEDSILARLLTHRPVSHYISRIPNLNTMFYRTAGGLYWKVFVNFPWPYHTTSNKQCFFQANFDRDVFVALFNSSLFWWYYTTTFDTFNLKDYMLFGFRFNYPEQPDLVEALREQSVLLMADFCRHARHLKRGQTGSYTIYARKSKPIIDTIDILLARHYGFSDQELDFIINYDIKYRLGLTYHTENADE
ncbi:Eco57I restriction-modification methylase domain-containing protein [Dictyobacter aurantiacus]|uniref:site-specific DNA-methyltransferase (adenine-specific) n=1 Tax=Dictyobacter aurantiacus TaxID=1936993 RepID=A0A401Z867_9CHLR|nr:DNA methyltransferase [Dictyobacter aurantiacus]GCE03008.1 hypothetical protein KDAU_03370 [Dictyobacter aurantiacus]